MKKKILVTGGAGYIGSHFVKEVLDNHSDEYEIIILDNLCKGYKEFIPDKVEFFEGDVGDEKVLDKIFSKGIFAVIHFAAFIEAGESMKDPQKYFLNNTEKTMMLLKNMLKNKCMNFIMSSTAAVYGEPEKIPVDENHATKPTNYYGLSKLMTEQILDSYSRVFGLKSIRLRYFNAAGAHPGGNIGEKHNPETHLIPIAIQTALGKREKLSIFGDDYETRDGTCIRDYVHVTDLSKAHILALKRIDRIETSEVYNLGSEKGFTVKEILDEVEKVTKKTIKKEKAPRREGDPAVLIASSARIKKVLGWKPESSDINTIISSAYEWHKNENMYDN